MTGKQFAVDQKFPTGAEIYWSPDGQYAVVTGQQVWLLDIAQQQLTLLRSPFIPGENSQPQWSPDSLHVIFYSNKALYHVSIRDNAVRPIAFYRQGTDSYSPWTWTAAGQLLSLEESYEEPMYLVVRQYNFQNGQYVRFDAPASGLGYTFRLSPDGQSLAWMNDGAEILDIKTQSVRKISPTALAFNTDHSGEVVWSSDSEWLMMFDNAVIAGGGPYRYVSLVRRNGTMRRDLTFADGWRPDYFGFLPAQVKLSSLPPAQPKAPSLKPEKRLTGGEEWVMYISWSPDGTQLVGGLPSSYSLHGSSPLWQWDVKSGAVKLAFEKVDNEQGVLWERSTDGVYFPKLVSSPRSRTIATSPDGNFNLILDIYNPAGALTLYDTKARQTVLTLEKGIGQWLCAAYSPDGHWIAVGNDSEIVIWNAQTRTIAAKIPVRTVALAFSPDGQTLAVGNGWDIDIWKVSDLVAP